MPSENKTSLEKMSQQFGNNQHFTGMKPCHSWLKHSLYFCIFLGTAHNYICSNLDNLANAVQPDPQEFQFLEYFLTNPALKELIDAFDTILNIQDVNLRPNNKDNIPIIRSLLDDLEPILPTNSSSDAL